MLVLMSFLMMLVTLLIGVKLANELAAAEQAGGSPHPHYLPRSQPPAFLRPAPPCRPGLFVFAAGPLSYGGVECLACRIWL